MSQHYFIAHSFDIIIITLNALDIHALDEITLTSNELDLQEMFLLRANNYMRYQISYKKHTNYQYLKVIQVIDKVISKQHIQTNIIDILRDITQNHNNLKKCSKKTQNYIKRFIINYRKLLNPYLVGNLKYLNNRYIIEISLLNIYLLNQIYMYNSNLTFGILHTIHDK
uniref:Uncharacterized protein n=1 Tax=Dichotomaria marginata TaxID=268567 RepID=A0A1G4NSL8_9FLOR|nr:Hypothetical protein ORF_6 [Dichotomaria marginata]SCW21650.1 Hypothetical protein ORF_6 [Dichotomaria marginata]